MECLSNMVFMFFLQTCFFCLFYTYSFSIEQVIKGLDRAVATMRKGERSIVTVKPDFGYGGVEVQTALAKIPPSSTLTYEVEMVDFTKVTHRILV